MENINIKKIECLNFEKIELEKLIKDIVNNHETIYNDQKKQSIIWDQTKKINDLEHHLERLRDVYRNLKIHYPPKYQPFISEK
jgi:hypothetical protein